MRRAGTSRATRVAAAAALALVTGCSGGTEDAADDAAGPAASVTPGAELLAVVGTEEDPNAYEITVTDSSGRRVGDLPPGDYTIRVRDLSPIHNVHLVGPGVDEATSVSRVEEATWSVTLQEGEYEYLCDPHPSMRGELTAG
jgi:hypothetical protein